MFALKGLPGYIAVREVNACQVCGVYAAPGAQLPKR